MTVLSSSLRIPALGRPAESARVLRSVVHYHGRTRYIELGQCDGTKSGQVQPLRGGGSIAAAARVTLPTPCGALATAATVWLHPA